MVDKELVLNISISGPRASGKTSLAMAIARFLNAHGNDVIYEGHHRHHSKLISRRIYSNEQIPLMHMAKIIIEDKS